MPPSYLPNMQFNTSSCLACANVLPRFSEKEVKYVLQRRNEFPHSQMCLGERKGR